jgi:ribonuclease HII
MRVSSCGKSRSRINYNGELPDPLVFEQGLWRQFFLRVAGVDEAGRGPLAGPVVAAAVVFSPWQKPIAGIDDSKKLTAGQRFAIKPIIEQCSLAVGVGVVSEQEIDEINILQATLKAMQLAIRSLTMEPDYVLVDGNRAPCYHLPCTCIIKGDSKSMSIAAASIVAKVTRDEIMHEYDKIYPYYDFARNKGYPTQKHISAIRTHGFCPIHRRSFKSKQLQRTDEVFY